MKHIFSFCFLPCSAVGYTSLLERSVKFLELGVRTMNGFIRILEFVDDILDDKLHVQSSGPIRPRQGTEICNFGAPSPLEALHWIFCSFFGFYVQFSKKSPRKSGESSEKSSGENRIKSCHVCGCHGFFGPEISVLL